MKTAIQVITVLFLLPWPALVMMSPMAFFSADLPNRDLLLLSSLFYYPVLIFLFYYFSNSTFLGTSPKALLLIAIILPTLILTVLGIPKRMLNNSKGISNVGFSVVESGVYYAGEKLNYVDAATFQILPYDYARDKNYIYYRKKIIDGADPITFETVIEPGPFDAKDKYRAYSYGKPTLLNK